MIAPDLRRIAEYHKEKLSKIKLFLCDVDGILTDGRVYWSGDEVGFNRFFHVHDGYGLKMLMNAGIKVGVISGGESVGVLKRAENLKLDYIKVGNEDKRKGYLEIIEESGLKDEEILYIADEFFDLPILKRVGFSATVPSASEEIKKVCDYITYKDSGLGCVRELVDVLRYVHNIVPEIKDFD